LQELVLRYHTRNVVRVLQVRGGDGKRKRQEKEEEEEEEIFKKQRTGTEGEEEEEEDVAEEMCEREVLVCDLTSDETDPSWSSAKIIK